MSLILYTFSIFVYYLYRVFTKFYLILLGFWVFYDWVVKNCHETKLRPRSELSSYPTRFRIYSLDSRLKQIHFVHRLWTTRRVRSKAKSSLSMHFRIDSWAAQTSAVPPHDLIHRSVVFRAILVNFPIWC